MKLQLTITIGLFLLTLLTATGQDVRVKGLLLPFIEHSVAVENLTPINLSVQLLYQNRTIIGDNRYYCHKVIPSIRYYFSSDKKFVNRLYVEVFYRYAYIKHLADQSEVPYYKYYSNSLGFDVGKQLFLSDNFFIDIGVGYYYIYSGKEQQNFSESDRNCLRLDLKFGLRFH